MKSKQGALPADVEIGRRIRLARMSAGISQQDLGQVCGITFQQIQKYEKGTNRVGGSRLLQIAEALKVAPAQLLGPTGDFNSETIGGIVASHASIADIGAVKLYLELGTEDRRSIQILIGRLRAGVPHSAEAAE